MEFYFCFECIDCKVVFVVVDILVSLIDDFLIVCKNIFMLIKKLKMVNEWEKKILFVGK